MKKILITNPLFQGLNEEEISSILGCLNATTKKYEQNQILFSQGDRNFKSGIIISGNVVILKEDFYGNRYIQASFSQGEIFAESVVCAGIESLPVTIMATENSEILFMDFNKILTTCAKSCQFHNKLIENTVALLAKKNLYLNNKIDILTQRTTREKLLTYLSSVARQKQKNEFEIDLNRQQLADYLCVERSALSAEIGNMCREGIIESKKGWFKLKVSGD